MAKLPVWQQAVGLLCIALAFHSLRTARASFSLGIASFNANELDAAKYEKYAEFYASIVGWQKIFLLQEVLNTSVASALVDNLNSRSQYVSNKPFRHISSKLLGPGPSRQQAYVFIYRSDFVTVEEVYQYPIQNYTVFQRPPYSVKFNSPVLGSFICTGMHTSRPAVNELRSLGGAVQQIRSSLDSDDILIMGDLNVGCGSVLPAEWLTISIATSSQYRWYVSSTIDTSLTGGCSDDRFIASSALSLRIPDSSVLVMHFQDWFKISKQEALLISTHYPIQLSVIQPEPSESQPIQTTISEEQLLKMYGYGEGLGCGYITTTLQGALTDGSGIAENYRNNLDCVWVILAPVNRTISLRVTYQFEHFYEDRLDVRDGYSLTSRLLSRMQNTGNRTVMTTGNALLLNFITDGSGTAPGFLATFTTSPRCDFTLTDVAGNFSSPVNVYTDKYPNNVHCVWNIRVPLGMVIKLSFSHFQVEPDERCTADYVIVKDGLVSQDISSLAPASDRALQLSQNTAPGTRLCGEILPQPFTSSANQIGIGFVSDYTNTNKGFTVTYAAVDRATCRNGFHFTGHHGNFEDNSGPSIDYEPNQNCTYYITVDEGYIISLKFLQLDIEASPACKFDYVIVRDGETGGVLKRECGGFAPQSLIVSSGRRMELQFVSDNFIEHTGFVVSYRACPRCADGEYAALPCFDVYSGFCAKCKVCSAGEVEVSACTTVADRVCRAPDSPTSAQLPRPCVDGQYECGDGTCVPDTVVCNGFPQCPDGSDELFCSCDGYYQFRCTSGKCIPQYRRCDGRANCLDGSDEFNCSCIQDMEFACTYNQAITKCIPRGWRCDGVPDCAFNTDEQGCQATEVDACNVDSLSKFSLYPSARLATISWVRRCLDSIPLRPATKNVTLSILRDSLINMYAYGDLVYDSLDSDSKLAPGLDYTAYNISVNVAQEFDRIAATDHQSAYQFHSDVTVLMSKFYDAHTQYFSPFSAITFGLPFVFGSVLVNGKQRITIRRVKDGTYPGYYELHKGPPFLNFDKFSSVFPNINGIQPENLVTSINGMPAMAFVRRYADQLGTYKSPGARFNNFLTSHNTFFLDHVPLPDNGTLDMVFDDNSAIQVQYTALIIVPKGISLRSLLSTQYSVKELVKFSEQNSLFKQFLRMYAGDDNVPVAQSGNGPQHPRRKRSASPTAEPKALQVLDSYDDKMFAFYYKGAIILKLTSFQLSKAGNSAVGVLEFLNRVVGLARSRGTSTLLLDVAGNGGGYIYVTALLLGFLQPQWTALPIATICNPIDVRISNYMTTLSGSLDRSRLNVSRPLGDGEARYYVNLVNTTVNGMLNFPPGTVTPDLVQNFSASVDLATSDAERSAVVAEFLESTVFTPVESAFLSTLQKPAGLHTGIALTLRQLVASAVPRRRGGRVSNYSAKYLSQYCLTQFDDGEVLALLPETAPFERIAVLSDGTCGSACSQFVSVLQLQGKATVVTYGGYAGEALDSTAFNGGNVEDWSTLWQHALGSAVWSRLIGSEPELTGQVYGFSVPLPLPSSARQSFDFTEQYMRQLGPDSLPREWYTLPGGIHLPHWTSGTTKWPLASAQQSALIALYTQALDAFASGTGSGQGYTPCVYKVECRQHSHNVYTTSSVVFSNVSLWRNDFSLFSDFECEPWSLLMSSSRYAHWRDLGVNSLSPRILSASDVRKLSIMPTQYTFTLYDQKWLDIFNTACPCLAQPMWVQGVARTIQPGTCLASRCGLASVTFNPLYGNYVLQGPTHIYISGESETASKALKLPIDGDAAFTLQTVHVICFPVTQAPTIPPPTTVLIEEGSIRAEHKYKHGWEQYEIYLGGHWVQVCGDGWDPPDGTVFCGQQFAAVLKSTTRTSSSLVLNASLPQTEPSVAFNCTGLELRLLECPRIVVKTCINDLIKVRCQPDPNAAPSSDHRALDYGVGISAGVAGLSIIIIVVYLIRKARLRATQFSSTDIASMQLGQPKSWWRWTPLNEGEDQDDFAYSADSINYAAT